MAQASKPERKEWGANMTKVTPRRVWSARHESELRDLLLMKVEGVYSDICEELDRTDPENNELCLLLSNFADDCDALISGMKRSREPKHDHSSV
jgi:hypothetical protein